MSQDRGWRVVRAGWTRRVISAGHGPSAILVVSALLAAAAVAEAVARIAGTQPQTHVDQQTLLLDLFAVTVFALATTLPMGFLGTVAAPVVICVASVLSLAIFRTLTVAGMVALLLTLYRLGRTSSPRSPVRLLAPGLAVPFLVLALAGHADTETTVLTTLLASIGPTAAWAGIAERARSEALMHDAARQVIVDTTVEHMALGERARIARELHDVVAHHISIIVVQAETARLTTPDLPTAGAQRLTEISGTARAGLTEMRRLLGVLRTEGEPGAAARHPLPSLEDLYDLLDSARNASRTGTRLIVSGTPTRLDPGTELAAYRIVQEALTNTRRHAPGAAVDVELHYTDDALRLRVRDDGPGLPAPTRPGGHGLRGMRERAMAVGGELRTGNAKGGGFAIEAILPARTEHHPPREG
jgi:signal transduction histidine kinase